MASPTLGRIDRTPSRDRKRQLTQLENSTFFQFVLNKNFFQPNSEISFGTDKNRLKSESYKKTAEVVATTSKFVRILIRHSRARMLSMIKVALTATSGAQSDAEIT